MKPARTSPQKQGMSSPRTDEEIIDEAIDESFPASDAPSHTPTNGSGGQELRPAIPVQQERSSSSSHGQRPRNRKVS